ncbi:transmembrane protein, putative [Medicago truncatula]|uniref:Transmembrane protein, putative n=1 Tax=Medicago truncatula TaxID=3880 RepID=G8A1T7_MEDTR|nr:transmembrane protein, putative [Medicago truncatula]
MVFTIQHYFFNFQHSTSFSLSYSTLIQHLPSPMVFHSTFYPTTFYFLFLFNFCFYNYIKLSIIIKLK